VMDDKGGEEKNIKSYLSVCCGGETVWPTSQTGLTGLCWALPSFYVSSYLLS
jgi:hypothetical protein